MSALRNEIAAVGRTYPVGVSVGVAHYPLDGRTADAVMHRADLAMCKANPGKRSGVQLSEAA